MSLNTKKEEEEENSSWKKMYLTSMLVSAFPLQVLTPDTVLSVMGECVT